MRSEEAARSEPGAPGAATLGLGKGGGPGGEGAGEVRGRPAGTQRGARLAERSPRPSGPEDKGADTRALQVGWSGVGTARRRELACASPRGCWRRRGGEPWPHLRRIQDADSRRP